MAEQVALDLHVHTALSPCGGEEMRPPEILLTAERRGLAIIGITDHSTAGNAAAMLGAAQAFAVEVMVGLELESAEGVHVLALFDTAEAALTMGEIIAAHLPLACNRANIFGEQQLLDEWGRLVGVDERLLVAATDLSIERLAQETVACGGLFVPAHVDRKANGLFTALGFLPPRLPFDWLEITPHITRTEACARWPQLRGQPLVQSSDAHYLADLGRGQTLISAALAGQLGQWPLREWGQAVAEELRSGVEN